MRSTPRRPIAELNLFLTSACNLRCGYCYQSRRETRRMGWGTARGALDWALAAGQPGLRIVFTGGEPLLALPLIRRAVAYVRERSPAGRSLQFVLQTNGTLLSEDAVEFLARNGFEIRLSFDGRPAVQDLRARGSFHYLDGLLDRMRRQHPDLYRQGLILSLTLVPETVDRLADSVGYFLEKGVARLGITPSLVTTADWRMERIVELEGQLARVLQLSLERHRRYGEIPLLFLRGGAASHGITPDARAMCGVAAGRTPVVDVDGSVHGCVMLNGSVHSTKQPWLAEELTRLRIGRLSDPGLSERFERFAERAGQSPTLCRKESKYSSYGPCRDCPAFAGCIVCPVSIGLQPENTDPNRVPDFSCAFTRTAWEMRQRFHREVGSSAAGFRDGGERGRSDPLERLAGRPGLREAMEKLRVFAEAADRGPRMNTVESAKGRARSRPA